MEATVVQKGRKTCKTRRETAVQGTNDNSIVSKCSMASMGYFDDQYLQHFVCKLTRRAPLIHRGYYIRAKSIDYIFQKFLQGNHGKKQILSLGAGFDSAYFRLKAQLNDVVFYEIDFPDVVKRKCHMLKTKDALKNLIPELQTEKKNKDPLIEIDTPDYKLLGVDLTQINTLEALLKVCDVDFELPTLLLSECVLTYMTRRCSSAVVKWAAETFSNAVFVMYEQINPNDAFGLFMQNHFQVIGSPLKCINAFPLLPSQVERFQKLGWTHCEALDMNQFYNKLVLPHERNIVEHLEPFDEYEEWHLKCAHYMILCGYSGTISPMLSDISTSPLSKQTQNSDTMETAIVIQPIEMESDNYIQRIGHSSVCLHGNQYLVTIGGFGEQEGKHKRLTSVSLLNIRNYKCYNVTFEAKEEEVEIIRMHHTACVLKDGSVLLIGGRISPIRVCAQLISVQVSGLKLKTDNWENRESDNLENCVVKVQIDEKSRENGNVLLTEEERQKENKFLEKEDLVRSEVKDEMISQFEFGKTEILCESNSQQSSSSSSGLKSEMFENKNKQPSDLEVKNESRQILNSEGDSKNKQTSNSEGENESRPCSVINSEIESSSRQKSDVEDKIRISQISRNDVENESISQIENKNSVFQNNSENVSRKHFESEIKSKHCDKEGEFHVSDKIEVPMDGDSRRCCQSEEIPTVICSVLNQNGEIPSPRWRHSAITFNKNGSEYVFLYGGRTENDLTLKDGYILDVTTGCWTKLPSGIHDPGNRHTHAVCKWNDLILLSGGLDADLQPTKSLYAFNVETYEWNKLEVSGTLYERYSHTAHVVENYLILIGGVNLHHSPPGVAIIDLQTNQSMEFHLPPQDKANLIMLHRHTSTYIGDGRFLIVGGGGNCFSFGTHLNKSPFVLDISKCLNTMKENRKLTN